MVRRASLSQIMLIIVLAAAMLIARAASAQEMSLRAVYNAVSGVMAPIWVAQEGGLFTKHGVNVDLKYLAATTAVDRKSTRLNSSHQIISYAVFCLKKTKLKQ